MKLIKEILKLLLGYKYRAVILKDRGVERYWICSYIFEDTPSGNARLDKYLRELEAEVQAHVYYETITFRSRREYGGLLAEAQSWQINRHENAIAWLHKNSKNLRKYPR